VKRILIADDEDMNRELLRELLEDSGYEVREASDGTEAFAIACNEMPSLILLDVRMPRMDGYSVLSNLRQRPDTAALPVIAVTAFAMDSDRERLEAAGFDAYISKPLNFNFLLSTISRLLDGKR
jgi:two-component system cell cycle response regulator DivK